MTTEPVDLYAPAAVGSRMRAIKIDRPGLWRLARRDCELYSVMIVSSGSWGRFRILTGKGRPVFYQPSSFTGSFVIGGGCEDGIVVEVAALDVAVNLTINWREPDTTMV